MLLAATVAIGGLASLALPTAVQAQAYISVQIGTPPPPPRYEVVPAARPGWVWAPGHYEWVHNNHIWRRGHWVQARPGHVYVPAAWRAQGQRWVYQPPRWDARPVRAVQTAPRHWDRHDYRDRRDPRGQRDARQRWDRDGDGVPNRRDRRPNDPRRY
ncbi:MAG: YXWGXW repeat-containing protein [Burkholderiales bacterium]|nr:YXWGXW repeat-containing protein [Burkholderiales bacterium]MBK8664398.1 YXWGXW repeat-containing protein [Burkholderiales bacterium]